MSRPAGSSPPCEESDASVPETTRNEAGDIAASATERAGQVTDVIGEQANAVMSVMSECRVNQSAADGAGFPVAGEIRSAAAEIAGQVQDAKDKVVRSNHIRCKPSNAYPPLSHGISYELQSA
jgi:hypothetical protein